MQQRIVVVIGLLLGISQTSAAGGAFAPWTNHAPPFAFLFGNELDGHQQTRLAQNGDLFGFLYVQFTGVTTRDGLRVATHVDCNTVTDCRPAWTLLGKPRFATFLYQVAEDHPIFLLVRSDIPQPGGFSHFHRSGGAEDTTGEGFVLQLVALRTFCFIHHGAEGAESTATCEDNGGVAVRPGLDLATHLNIVASFPAADSLIE